jgi:putative glutamine amidotransferase
LRATAWAPDGVIEAVEMQRGDEWIMGVQWHPEWLEAHGSDPRTAAGGRASGGAVFEAFVAECRARMMTPP